MTSSQAVIECLKLANKPMATHEVRAYIFENFGLSFNENNLATRCSELSHCGKIAGNIRQGKHYKEWWIPADENGQYRLFREAS